MRTTRRTTALSGALMLAVTTAVAGGNGAVAAPAPAAPTGATAYAPAPVTAPAPQQDPGVIVDGVTAPVYSYADAVRESVWVQAPDLDGDGETDQVAVDIVRPAELDGVAEVPVVMMASPYFTCCGRGNESERKAWDEDGDPTLFPMHYDNYFVPRGYAYVAVDIAGTSRSTGCVDMGGASDILSAKAVVDWLGGRAEAVDAAGDPVQASWTNGRTGMIGKSYDGTIANGVAATGVEGLETIVPIGAISSWYDYTRSQDLLYSTNYAPWLSSYVMGQRLQPQDCSAQLAQMGVEQDDATGQYNDFWAERDYRAGTLGTAAEVEASVYVVHGLQDNNVKTRNFGQWWESLGEAGVDRKMWLMRTGHTDPFDTDREEWMHELHRWFDSELMDVDNGIWDEPAVRSETGVRTVEHSQTWPVARTTAVLRPQADGGLVLRRADRSTADFVNDRRMREATAVTQDGEGRRLLFATGAMKRDTRISGKPVLDVTLTHDAPQGQVAVYLVDYGTSERVLDTGDGIRTGTEESCWGESTATDDACYREVDLRTGETPLQIVARGWARLEGAGTHEVSVELQHNDVTIAKGHRLGLVVAASSTGRVVTVDSADTPYTVDLGDTALHLPLTGPMSSFAPGALNLPRAAELPAGTVPTETARQRPGQ